MSLSSGRISSPPRSINLIKFRIEHGMDMARTMKSIMHKDRLSFVIQEAYYNGKFSMIEKETGEGLVVNYAPRLSSVLGSKKLRHFQEASFSALR